MCHLLLAMGTKIPNSPIGEESPSTLAADVTTETAEGVEPPGEAAEKSAPATGKAAPSSVSDIPKNNTVAKGGSISEGIFNPAQSSAIQRNPVQSSAIQRNPAQSSAIQRNPAQSSTI